VNTGYYIARAVKGACMIIEIERRKLMALGKSSVVVSMPKPWLNMNSLNKGDSVSLQIQPDGSLIIHPTFDILDKIKDIHLLIDVNESEDSIVRRIIASYLNGYKIIKLTSQKIFNENQHRAIRKITSTLYMMIVESGGSAITLQSLIDESQASVLISIERMQIMTYSMCRDILNALNNLDEEVVKSVLLIEDDIDQLMLLLLRIIRSASINPSLANKLGLDPLDCLDYQTLVHRIERIADHNTIIASNIIALINSGIDVPNNLKQILIDTAEIAFNSFDLSVNGFISNDISQTNSIIDNEKKIIELQKDITPVPLFVNQNNVSTLANIIAIRESIKKIAHYAADIGELAIDRTYKSSEI